MNRTLSLPVQELIRATERVMVFATNHKGLLEEDFEAVLSCAHELRHDIKSSRAASRAASQELQVCLLFCLLCRLVRDEQETADAPWTTQQTYQQSTGIDPTDCLLIHTYCPACYQHLSKAA
jgi:hypothetical protein